MECREGNAVELPFEDGLPSIWWCVSRVQFFPDRLAGLVQMRRLRGLVSEAGFRDITIRQAAKLLTFPSPEAFVWQ
jgi:hypothetical protein